MESETTIATGHPAKRRKVSPREDVLKEVIEQVYFLLGSQKASDLDGLSQVAASVTVSVALCSTS